MEEDACGAASGGLSPLLMAEERTWAAPCGTAASLLAAPDARSAALHGDRCKVSGTLEVAAESLPLRLLVGVMLLPLQLLVAAWPALTAEGEKSSRPAMEL